MDSLQPLASTTRVNFLVEEVTGKRHPQVGVDGKFSVSHCVAVSFLDGRVEEEQFTDTRVLDPKVMALSDKVTAVVDREMPADAVHMEVKLRDCRKLVKDIRHALGSLENPLSDEQLDEKFRRLCEGILDPVRVEPMIAQCRGLAELADVGTIARSAAVA